MKPLLIVLIILGCVRKAASRRRRQKLFKNAVRPSLVIPAVHKLENDLNIQLLDRMGIARDLREPVKCYWKRP